MANQCDPPGRKFSAATTCDKANDRVVVSVGSMSQMWEGSQAAKPRQSRIERSLVFLISNIV